MSHSLQTGPEATARAVHWSWPRFVRLARAHWVEHFRAYLGYLLACGILCAVFLLLAMAMTSGRGIAPDVQATIYFVGLYLSGFVFAARYFEGMARRESALLLLMRPASMLEKWLLCLMVVAVAYPVAYTALFTALLGAARQLMLVAAALGPQIHASPLYAQDLFIPLVPPAHSEIWRALTVRQQAAFFIGVVALQAIAVSGALYFRRASLLKTVALVIGLLTLTSLWVAVAGAQGDVIFAWWQPHAAARDWAVHALNALLWLGLPALLWLQALVHLREKELA